LTLTEALTAGLPAVTFRPIPGHGTANAGTLADAGLAPWPKDAEELSEILRGYQKLKGDRAAVVRDPDAASVIIDLLAEIGATEEPSTEGTRSRRYRLLRRTA
jgi:UDP-N-acetylglucosamine:LPS N-acetylglucosamine transferase